MSTGQFATVSLDETKDNAAPALGQGSVGGSVGSVDASARRITKGGNLNAQYSIRINQGVAWNIEEVTIGKGKNRKTILRNIWGQAKTGTVTSILGPSGSGKTTFMECISLRNRNFRGALRVDGQPITPLYLTSVAFVYQKQFFAGSLTVRELITFNAIAKMSKKFPRDVINQRVQEVLEEAKLIKCADTLIGSLDPIFSIKGISGGEAKRLALGVELLHSPDLIMLDEPTSGLDSVMAESVMQTLRDLANGGRMIIASLHSPSTFVMEMIDEILVISHMGTLAYHGPREDAVQNFLNQGYKKRPGISDTDFLLKVVSRPSETHFDEVEEQKRILKLREVFTASEYNITPVIEPDDSHQTVRGVEGVRATLPTLFMLNLWRGGLDLWRQKGIILLLWAVLVMINVMLGVLYWQQVNQNPRNLIGMAFSTTTATLMTGAFAMVIYMPQDIGLLRREVVAGTNTVLPFFMSKLILMIPVSFGSILGGIFLYWMTGMANNVGSFFGFLGVMVSLTFASFGVGVLACCIADNLMVAVSVLPALISPMTIFAGMLLERGTEPKWLGWLQYLSVINYSFSAIVLQQVDFLEPAFVREFVLDFLHIKRDQLHGDILALYLIFFGSIVLALGALTLRFRYANMIL